MRAPRDDKIVSSKVTGKDIKKSKGVVDFDS
jgi:hypothetical protein